jgi:hypothetical protein
MSFSVFSVCSCRLRLLSVQSAVRIEHGLYVQLMTVVLVVCRSAAAGCAFVVVDG